MPFTNSNNGAGAPKTKPEKELYPMSNWKYDAFLWSTSVLADLFFREIHPRGTWRVPQRDPVLFVAAPHANQFVDALILQRTLRNEAKRRVSLLVAQKSVHGFIGYASRQVGAVPVGRAQDSAKPAKGTIYLPDPINDPTLIRGIGTRFDEEAEVSGMIFLPSVKGQSGSSVDVAEIVGPEELRLRRPFKGKVPMSQLTGRSDIDEEGNFSDTSVSGCADNFEGTKFKFAPHIDQTKVYEAVFSRLRNGGTVGIFPEGGSHDRPGLLPLKAGVAIMALGTLVDAPNCGLKIVPVGMNYFHAHKFRSRAVIEFGSPFEIPNELVDMYRNGQRRDAIAQVLDMIQPALQAVTVSTPDYDTLMLISAARRLYNPKGKKLPLPAVIELNRRLAQGYEKYKDEEKTKQVVASVKAYNKQLMYLNIRDHQVQNARTKMPWWRMLALLFYRLGKLALLLIGVLPGLILFAPVFVATKLYSKKKAREALAGSSVKIQGRDVMATWKILVAMFFAPVLYNFYCILFVLKFGSDRLWGYVPDWATHLPWWMVFIIGWILFPTITFAALRFGEIGMDVFKSLRPLVLTLNPSSYYNIRKLRDRREELQVQVTELINTFGPELYDDFESTRLVKPEREMEPATPSHKRDGSDTSSVFEARTPEQAVARRHTTQSSRAIPRNESFSNIGRIDIFPTRPSSRSRSRSSSAGGGFGFGGFPVSGFTSLDSKGAFDETSKKIREVMHGRAQMRRRATKSKQEFTLAGDDSDEASSQDESPKKDT